MPFHTCTGKRFGDAELKQLIAKMLPDMVEWFPFSMEGDSEQEPFIAWRNGDDVLDTELLHLCSLAEAVMRSDQFTYTAYWRHLFQVVAGKRWGGDIGYFHFEMATATWQQRVTALAVVKGVSL